MRAIECLQRIQKRPISPDVFNIEDKGLHYKLEINAISSIMTRVTGCMLSGGALTVWSNLV